MSVQELLTSIYGDSDNQSHETRKSAVLTILGTFCKKSHCQSKGTKIKKNLDISNIFQEKKLLLQSVNSFQWKQTRSAIHELLSYLTPVSLFWTLTLIESET